MVTTSPVPFTALPRQVGTNVADVAATQTPFATAVDGDFTAVNTQLTNSWAKRFTVERVKPVLTLDANVKWYSTNNYVDGLIIGDLRMLMITVSWNGATIAADNYGGITDQKIGVVSDSRFRPGGGRQLYFVGDYSKGMCIFFLHSDGGLWLAGLNGRNATLVANEYIALNYSYLVYGS